MTTSNSWRKNTKSCTLMKIGIKKNIFKEKLSMVKSSKDKVRKATAPWTLDQTKIKADRAGNQEAVKAEAAKVTL